MKDIYGDIPEETSSGYDFDPVKTDWDYGKKMTDELGEAVQDVMSMSFREFKAEKGGKRIQEALEAAEAAPEATALDDSVRKLRIGELDDVYGKGNDQNDYVDTDLSGDGGAHQELIEFEKDPYEEEPEIGNLEEKDLDLEKLK